MNQTRSYTNTRKLITLALLSTIAILITSFIRVPVIGFLTYEPKDVIITIGSFLFGPLSAAMVALVVGLVEMLTVSATGPIGMLMNVLAACSFACVAGFIYKKKPTVQGAIIGLLAGTAALTTVMLLWNFFVTPFYMGVPRGEVVGMLVPVFLPFNLIKGLLNSAITLLLYKPIVGALRKANLAPPSVSVAGKGKINVGVMVTAAVVFATCIMLVLALQGTI